MPVVHKAGRPIGPTSTLECAARFAARSGFPTTVLVERRPGVVSMARSLADSCGLNVYVEMNPLTTAVRFSIARASTRLG